VAVHDFHILRTGRGPPEADAEVSIHPYTALPLTIVLQRLHQVPRRDPQVPQYECLVELVQLSPCAVYSQGPTTFLTDQPTREVSKRMKGLQWTNAWLLLGLMLTGCIADGRTHEANSEGATVHPVYEFRNGRWFDGNGFVEQTFFTQDGSLVIHRPARVDSVIDLDGRWVVPPYGEAHNHNVETPDGLPDLIRRYLASGVYYVKNPNVLPRSVLVIRGAVNLPSSIDASFALGGFTGPGGHPTLVYRRNVGRGIWSEADGEGAFFYELADEHDLDLKWAGFLAHRPDFVKAYLLYSEEISTRVRDPSYVGWRGLDPPLLTALTERSHAAGLRVSAHVETAQDFRHALDSGVDEITHLPGFRGNEDNQFPNPEQFQLTEQDARRAAANGVVVVTTLGEFDAFGDAETVARARETFRANLSLLKAQGVRLALGSDSYGSVGVDQAMQLSELGVFSNLELLKLWVEETPRTIFPFRRIGRLAPGYEASFLVLEGNPLEDFSQTQAIRIGVKNGVLLDVFDRR